MVVNEIIDWLTFELTAVNFNPFFTQAPLEALMLYSLSQTTAFISRMETYGSSNFRNNFCFATLVLEKLLKYS